MRLPAFALALAVAACNVATDPIPPSPLGRAPQVTAVAPLRAFADDAVTIALVNEPPSNRVEIRFGASLPVRAAREAGAWHVVVPLDATDGPVTVSNAEGATTYGETFTYLGAGHIRDGRVARERRLSPAIEDAHASALREGSFLLVRSPVPSVLVDQASDGSTYARPSDVIPHAITLDATGTRFAVVGHEDGDECLIGGAPALVALVYAISERDRTGSLGTLERRLCLGIAAGDRRATHVTATPGATHLLVSTRVGAEAAGDALHRVTTADGAVHSLAGTGGRLDSSAWAGDAFVAVDGDGVRRVPIAAEPAEWPRAAVPVQKEDLWEEQVNVVAAHASGAIAAGTSTGRVYVSSGGWPPAFTEKLDGIVVQRSPDAFDTDVVGLAFSPSGTELVATQDYYARVSLHRRTSEGWKVVGASNVAWPTRANATTNGTFMVVGADGAMLVSATTGAVVLSIVGGVYPRALRNGRCPTGEPALVIGTAVYPLVFRLDPRTLEDAPCGPAPIPDVGYTEEVEPAADGALFLRRDDETLLRISPGGAAEEIPHAVTIAQSLSERRLRLVAGGAALASFDRERRRLVLRDARASTWPEARTRTLELSAEFVDAYDLPNDTFVVVDGAALVLVPHAGILDGAGTPRRIPLDRTPTFAWPMGDDVLALEAREDTSTCSLAAVTLDDGRRHEVGAFDCEGRIHWVSASPDRRRLYVIAEDATGARELKRFVYDEKLRRVVGTERPIHLQLGDDPTSFRVLETSAAGDRLYVLDTYGDRLLAIE